MAVAYVHSKICVSQDLSATTISLQNAKFSPTMCFGAFMTKAICLKYAMQVARASSDHCEIIVWTGSSFSKFSTIDNNILWAISFTQSKCFTTITDISENDNLMLEQIKLVVPIILYI